VKVTTQPTANSSKRPSEARQQRGFWKFGAEFHGNEAVRSDATDFFVFTIMGVLCAWPIVSAIVAISRTLNGY